MNCRYMSNNYPQLSGDLVQAGLVPDTQTIIASKETKIGFIILVPFFKMFIVCSTGICLFGKHFSYNSRK